MTSLKATATRVLLATALAAAANAVAAAPAPPASTAPSTRAAVDDALRRLAAPDPAGRDAAQAELLAAGVSTEALDALAGASPDDADLRARIDALRVRVRDREMLSPSRVTIEGDNLALADVLAELGRQCHADFSADNLPDNNGQSVRLSLHLRDASFWQAIRAVTDATSMGLYPEGGPNGRWRLMRGNPGYSIRGEESGAFLVQPTYVTYNRSISLADNGRNNGPNGTTSFSMQVRLLAEPKFRLDGQSMVVVERATDSAGNDLLTSGQNRIGAGGSGSQLSFAIQLAYPTAPGKTIREAAGTIYVSVIDAVETIRSDDLLSDSPISRDLDGWPITIAATARAGGGVDLELSLPRPRDASDSNRVNRLMQVLPQSKLTGPDGQPLRFNGYQNSATPDGRQSVRATFLRNNAANPAVGPISLTLELPTSSRQIEVPFAIRDVPMP